MLEPDNFVVKEYFRKRIGDEGLKIMMTVTVLDISISAMIAEQLMVRVLEVVNGLSALLSMILI